MWLKNNNETKENYDKNNEKEIIWVTQLNLDT